MDGRRIVMPYFLIALAAIVQSMFTPPLDAQHGQAEPGYYPPEYVGDTWQGNVTDVDDIQRTITLAYTKGSKSQTFTLRLAQGLAVTYTDGTSKQIKPSDIPVGAAVMSYYTNYSERVEGKKADVHEAFMLRVKTVDGKEHNYKAPFDPKLKSWGQGGIQITGGADRSE
ncbi:MAG TPA: hypothetical protein VNU84_00450 [Candidatus Acidoferrum sp.]|jgi:hypothetical protein|nr:hypothetical protein [Candidatus Acidoferrum sp.]